MALPPVDVSREQERPYIVRQGPLSGLEFSASAIVIEISPVEMLGHGQMRFARVRAQTAERLNGGASQGEPAWSVVESKLINLIVSVCQLIVGQKKRGIVFYGLVQQLHRFE